MGKRNDAGFLITNVGNDGRRGERRKKTTTLDSRLRMSGMTEGEERGRKKQRRRIPAFAGMTEGGKKDDRRRKMARRGI